MNDFIIENGILTKYQGPGGDVVIPDGVTRIDSFAFSDCTCLEECDDSEQCDQYWQLCLFLVQQPTVCNTPE